MSSSDVKTKVKIKGLPENCTNTFSGTGTILPILDVMPWDEYREPSLLEELGRMEYLAVSLQNDKESKAVIDMWFRNIDERN